MFYTLENAYIKLTVNSLGAEKFSIVGKKTNLEFLWNGDKTHWRNRAPVLFPIVGRLFNGVCRIDGSEYKMDCHGFAQVSEFTALSQNNDSIVLEITANDVTKQVYPYDFKFRVAYQLDDNDIIVRYDVENTGGVDMIFAVGAHPGFMCPLVNGEAFTDYYLEFSEAETADILRVRADGYFEEGSIPFLNDEKIIPLHYDLFKNDALVFHKLRSDTICLKSKKSGAYVKVNYAGFNYLGIWTRADAPYVCIEPWTSLGDYHGYNGEFMKKPGMSVLQPGSVYSVNHTVSLYE